MANTNRDVINQSMGLSQDPNFDDIQSAMGGSQAGGPIVAPTYLPTLTTAGASYYAVHSNERLLQAYAGPMAKAGGADLGAGATGITPSAVQSVRGGNEAARAETWYDQTGNARHLLAPATSARPALHEAFLIGGKPVMLMDSLRETEPHWLLLNGISIARRDFTFIGLVDPNTAANPSTQMCFGQGNVGSGSSGFGDGDVRPLQDPQYNASQTVYVAPGMGLQTTGQYIATSPETFVVRGRSDGTLTINMGDRTHSLGTLDAGTMAQLALGSLLGDTKYTGNQRWLASVLVAGALSDADIAAVRSSLLSRWDLSSPYQAVVARMGSSRDAGASGNLTAGYPFNERASLTKKVRNFNFGIDAASIQSQNALFRAACASVYDSTLPVAYIIGDHINALGGLGGQNSDPAVIYAAITSMVTYLKGLGPNVRVVAETTCAQDSTIYPSPGDVETRRLSLNAMIRANAAGADAIADKGADSKFANQAAASNTTYYNADKIHFTRATYEYLSVISANAINSVI